jgi:hypothetical protein
MIHVLGYVFILLGVLLGVLVLWDRAEGAHRALRVQVEQIAASLPSLATASQIESLRKDIERDMDAVVTVLGAQIAPLAVRPPVPPAPSSPLAPAPLPTAEEPDEDGATHVYEYGASASPR